MAQSSSQCQQLPLTMEDVREAEERIKGHIHKTPVLTSSKLDSLAGHRLFFKCELFQKTGSFKVRANTCSTSLSSYDNEPAVLENGMTRNH